MESVNQAVVLLSSELLYLEGTNEPAADTIRKLLATHMTVPNVVLISEGGVNSGGRTITGITAAYVDIISRDGSNQFRVTWRELGEARNDWTFFIRGGSSARIDIRNAQSQIRITWPDSSNFKLFYDYIRLSTDITNLFTVSALSGTSDDAEAGKAPQTTYDFEHGADDVVDNEVELSTQDMGFFEKLEALFLKVYDGDTRVVESSNSFVYFERIVHIDIFGNRAHTNNQPGIQALQDQVDDIILGNVKGPYPKSATDGNSAIISLAVHGVNWVRTAEKQDDGITESIHGELPVRMQRSITTS